MTVTKATKKLTLGRGGSSGGSTSASALRGPGFDSRWELGFFMFPILSEACLFLIRSLVELRDN